VTVIAAGSALLLALPPKPHLWFVLTNPDEQAAVVVAVMMVSRKRHTDDTVILNVGDHPFIRHESAIQYSTATRFQLHKLLRDVGTGRCHLRESMSPALLERVRAGLLESPFTVHAIRDYCAPRFG
jgi:hypothetical protein